MKRKTAARQSRRIQRREEKKNGPVHFRLCHFCLYLNEAGAEVGQCARCRRHLTFGAMLRDVTPEEIAEAWINEGFEGTEEEAEDVAAEELQELEDSYKQGRTTLDPATGAEKPVPPLTGLSVIW